MRQISAFVVVACIWLIASQHANADSFQLKREGGVLVLPVQVNNSITLDFTIDSGATDVVIPLDVFSTLSRAGTITSKDMLDSQTYELADGSRHEARRFRIRSLKIGELELQNVVGSIAPAGGTLLLGQSFLSHLPAWSIDNQHDLLVVGKAGNTPESGNKKSDSLNHVTRSSATTGLSEPLWILVGSIPENGRPDQIFQFIDLGNIRNLQPAVRAAWVKAAYWFNIRYPHHGGPIEPDLEARLIDSDVQQAITSAAPIEGGSFLAEFNCSTSLWKPLNYDKWEGVAPASIEALEQKMVCAAER